MKPLDRSKLRRPQAPTTGVGAIFGAAPDLPDPLGPPPLVLIIPMRTSNPLNGSQGTTAHGRRWRASEAKKQRHDAWAHVRSALQAYGFRLAQDDPSGAFTTAAAAAVYAEIRMGLRNGVRITLTRIAPRPVSDEAIAATLKHARDGVADALGFRDDDDPRLLWSYAQRKPEKGAAVRYGVMVSIGALPGPLYRCKVCGGEWYGQVKLCASGRRECMGGETEWVVAKGGE